MRISDWSSDVCSSDLLLTRDEPIKIICIAPDNVARDEPTLVKRSLAALRISVIALHDGWCTDQQLPLSAVRQIGERFVHNTQLWLRQLRSEEHTSELQSLMRISHAVLCLKKKSKLLTSHTTLTALIP